MVVPICGSRGCLRGYVSDILGRDLERVRLVYISSNSASSSPQVLRTFTGDSSHIGLLRRRGLCTNITHGGNVGTTYNGCFTF